MEIENTIELGITIYYGDALYTLSHIWNESTHKQFYVFYIFGTFSFVRSL